MSIKKYISQKWKSISTGSGSRREVGLEQEVDLEEVEVDLEQGVVLRVGEDAGRRGRLLLRICGRGGRWLLWTLVAGNAGRCELL